MPDTVVVVAGGSAPAASALAAIPRDALVIGADRGAEHARASGLRVELAVGDFDSISEAALAELAAAGTLVDRHPPEKEATDLELALDAALVHDPRRILVVGGIEGRLDHLLGELSLLAAARYAAVELDALLGDATINVVRSERTLHDDVGTLISLFAQHGPAAGVTTEGLVYALRSETLVPGSSRGISNVFAAPEARISVADGVLLAVRPGARALA